MEKVKIKDINTGAIKEVKKTLASDYIGTGKFVLYTEKEINKIEEIKEDKKPEVSKNNFINRKK